MTETMLPPDAASRDAASLDALRRTSEAVREKLTDALTPGFQAEFDPIEAEHAGAFEEDALSERDALESQADLIEAIAPFGRGEG